MWPGRPDQPHVVETNEGRRPTWLDRSRASPRAPTVRDAWAVHGDGPFRGGAEVDAMVLAPSSVELADRRERFLSGGDVAVDVRPEILTSWRRCLLSGVDPVVGSAPFDGAVAGLGGRLVTHGVPVLAAFADHLAETDVSLALTDAGGRMLWRWVSERHLRAKMDDLSVTTGFRFAEDCVGTNGIGTALELRRPVQVNGYEHFAEALDVFCCTAAPVRDAVGGQLLGAVNLTCPVQDGSELMLPMIGQLARQIESAVVDEATPVERLLLQAFVTARRHTRRPVFAVNADVLIADRAATDLLAEMDRDQLWDRVRRGLGASAPVPLVADDTGATVHGRCLPVGDPREPAGAVVTVEPAPGSRRAPRPARPGVPGLPGLSGCSPWWHRVVAATRAVAAETSPVLVHGEPGVGKAALVAALARLDGRELLAVECAAEATEGPGGWVERVARALHGPDRLVLLRHVEALSDRACHLLGPLLDRARAGGPRVAATCTATNAGIPPLPRALVDRLVGRRIEIPPLRLRPEDVRAVVLDATRASPVQVRRDAMRALERHAWPGNTRELVSLLRGLVDEDAPGTVTPDDLPAEVRRSAVRRRLSLAEAAERDLLVRTLDQCGENRSMAARTLGLSRSTLYRRLRAYDLRG